MAGRTWASDLTTFRPITGEAAGVSRRATLPAVIKDAAVLRADRILYVRPDGGEVTTAQFYGLARHVAKGLIALGVQPGQGVGILGANSVEWFASDWGAVLAGALPAPSYPTNSSETVAYIADHSSTAITFVDDDHALIKAIAAKAQCNGATLRTIVAWGADVDLSKYPDHASYLLTWDEFLDAGHIISDADVDHRMALATPEACAKLIYTSGTTGPPKAVMITHDNLLWIAHVVMRDVEATPADVLLSFLPASHIAANAVDVVGPVVSGVTTHLAKPDALRGSLVESLRVVRPTIFLAVPRVWEKIHERMLDMRSSLGPLKLALSDWAKSIGTAACAAEDMDQNTVLPFGTWMASLLVFSNVRKALGLDRARLVVNSAAPLQQATNDYFRSLRIKIVDVYGMSEASGPYTSASEYRYKSSGKVLPGVELKLVGKELATGEGEMCFRGRNIFLGYLSNPEETTKVMDSDGYFHTGDIGRVDDDGFVYVTGRVKEIMVTSGGENVAPVLIESELRTAMPAIARAFAVGDARKYVSCLLVPFVNDAGELIGPAANVSSTAKTGYDAVNDAAWGDYVKAGIAKANESSLSQVSKVKNYTLLPHDFSMENGELTPTLKVRRNAVVSNYSDIIDSMYA
jgi:long-subunit acyl-CoA synthetase (AMP-forming)